MRINRLALVVALSVGLLIAAIGIGLAVAFAGPRYFLLNAFVAAVCGFGLARGGMALLRLYGSTDR